MVSPLRQISVTRERLLGRPCREAQSEGWRPSQCSLETRHKRERFPIPRIQLVRSKSSSDKLGRQGMPEVRYFQSENETLGLGCEEPVTWQSVYCDGVRRCKGIWRSSLFQHCFRMSQWLGGKAERPAQALEQRVNSYSSTVDSLQVADSVRRLCCIETLAYFHH